MQRLLPVILFLLTGFLLFNSCTKEQFETGQANLEISQDTIIFDTVFTTVGSATQVFNVYNRGSKAVKISSIRIAGGENSNFRLNVDGLPGKSFTDVEIGANDSIFIFAEVTVDPNNINTPYLITDSIIFIATDFQQGVALVAYGQDAHFHSAPTNSTIAPFFFLSCNEIWDKDKPHVVYGYALVDSGCTLTINAGANVYFHPGSGIIVCNSGTLLVNGTILENVTFQGDRLGVDYKDIPGQWDRIWLSNLNLHTNTSTSPGSNSSSIKYAVIKNGFIGLLVDTFFDNVPTHATLTLENTIIKNMASNAIACRGARVNAYNCVFANCGAQTTNILYGGKYNFYHCTFANFWNNSQRQDPALSLNNYTSFARPLDAFFGNCIVYGNNDNELGLDSVPNANLFGFRFDHSLIKVDNTIPTSDPSHYNAIIRASGSNYNPNFSDVDNNFYQLDSLNSPAVDAGDITITNLNSILNNDILGVSRPQRTKPDLGAYERQ